MLVFATTRADPLALSCCVTRAEEQPRRNGSCSRTTEKVWVQEMVRGPSVSVHPGFLGGYSFFDIAVWRYGSSRRGLGAEMRGAGRLGNRRGRRLLCDKGCDRSFLAKDKQAVGN